MQLAPTCVPHENNEAAVAAVTQTRPVQLKTYFRTRTWSSDDGGKDEAVDKQRETLKDGAEIHERALRQASPSVLVPRRLSANIIEGLKRRSPRVKSRYLSGHTLLSQTALCWYTSD